MTAVFVTACAVSGLLVGSFLNVVIWRVPRGESIVSPPSRCPGCERRVRPRDNIPVISWLMLRGRCRHCQAAISRRYPAVEVLTALVFATLGAVIGPRWDLPAFLYLGAAGVALASIDLDVKRLPNVIVLPSYVVAAALLALPAVLNGQSDDYLRAAAGAALLFGVYFALVLVYPAGMGSGDVKLAGVLGAYLAWLGWGPWGVGAFAGFLFGGLLGGLLMLAGRANRKSAIPFGPFMLAGALLGILFGHDLASLYVDGLVA